MNDHLQSCFFLLITNWKCSPRPKGRRFKKSLKIPKRQIRIRISKKNRQHNGQKKKYKRTNNDQQNIHMKLKIE